MDEKTLVVSVNSGAIANISANRDKLKEFVSKQLIEGINHDYAQIPGTPKKSLLKPGAEKIAQLFGFGSRIVDSSKDIDLHTQFAMFTYRIEVYHLQSGIAIAQSEGSANTLEDKFKGVPFGRALNNLQKMAQKRAYVSAVIAASAASDYLTQDMEHAEEGEISRARASVPNATGGQRSDMNSAPMCCERPMMVSKFDPSKWYCPGCKAAKERAA